MNSSKISLVILCYNDGPSISELVLKAFRTLEKSFAFYEIVITDDGSNDETLQILENLKNKYPSIIITGHSKNKGVGANFTNGIKATKYDFIAYIDGDGQYLPDDIPVLFNYLKPDNMVSGIRIKRKDSIIRKIVTLVYNQTLKSIYSINCKDVNSGIKLFNRDALLNFKIESTGPFFDAEVMIKHIAQGYTITEVPVNHFHREFGKAGGISIKNLRMTFNEIFSAKFKQYRRRRN